MLCTLLAPTAGRALVAGYDVAAEPGRVRLRIGVALQDAALDPGQTGTELLRLQGRLYGLSRRALARRLAELGELIELGDALDGPIGTYSGGMKRRLDLAAALGGAFRGALPGIGPGSFTGAICPVPHETEAIVSKGIPT